MTTRTIGGELLDVLADAKRMLTPPAGGWGASPIPLIVQSSEAGLKVAEAIRLLETRGLHAAEEVAA